jgi:hypothetical protein
MKLNKYAKELAMDLGLNAVDAYMMSLKSELYEKYSVIIRNNNLESDYEYNNVNYFNSKMKSEDIVVPDEVKNNSTRVYFLVEEGARMMYFEDSMAMN